jgi:hypothetical protein
VEDWEGGGRLNLSILKLTKPFEDFADGEQGPTHLDVIIPILPAHHNKCTTILPAHHNRDSFPRATVHSFLSPQCAFSHRLPHGTELHCTTLKCPSLQHRIRVPRTSWPAQWSRSKLTQRVPRCATHNVVDFTARCVLCLATLRLAKSADVPDSASAASLCQSQ